VDHPGYRLIVAPEEAGQRLDRYLAQRLPDLSRTRIQDLIADGAVTVRGKTARPATRVSAGEVIEVVVPPPVAVRLEPEAIPLDVVYEDADLLVINKPAGLVVHPAPGHAGGTLVNALLARCPDLAGIGGELRPGIVHRLDKDTSGLIIVAKHDRAHQFLAAQLKERRIDKRYLALVDGAPASESGTIDAPIARDPRHRQRMAVVAGGRPAVTHFRVRRRYARHTLLECRPVTGRTHQIRVHLAAIGCPVAGDRVYGRKEPTLPLDRHFLHAARLTFTLPSGQTRTFEAPLPPDLQRVLDRLDQRLPEQAAPGRQRLPPATGSGPPY
jgi:23S rRNA pseudouridine1911/1915/1917 synthase